VAAFDYPTLGTGYVLPISETLSRAAIERTIGVPFRIDVDGSVAVAEGRSNIIRQEMLMMILTYLGERLMMPFYGSNLAQFVWEPQSQGTIDVFLGEMQSLINTHFPEVTIVDLSSNDDGANDGELLIQLDYQINDAFQSLTVDASNLLLEGQ
jgi:phage baseplate assembly protein W